jgi:hypothetical protein
MKVALLLSLPLAASAAGFIEMKPSKYPPRIHKDAQRTLSKYGRKFNPFYENVSLSNNFLKHLS